MDYYGYLIRATYNQRKLEVYASIFTRRKITLSFLKELRMNEIDEETALIIIDFSMK